MVGTRLPHVGEHQSMDARGDHCVSGFLRDISAFLLPRVHKAWIPRKIGSPVNNGCSRLLLCAPFGGMYRRNRAMTLTYSQRMASTTHHLSPLNKLTSLIVIKLALTDTAAQGIADNVSLSRLRQRSRLCTTFCLVLSSGFVIVHARARKAKKRLGPRFNKSMEQVLHNEVGCVCIFL